jgi:ATP-dependent DNA helicase RecQ
LDPAAKAVWDALRAWRLAEARRQELPPYVIFHDSTLSELARCRPLSLAELAQIPGIGRSKLDRYGSAVIAIVAGGALHPVRSAPEVMVPETGGAENDPAI